MWAYFLVEGQGDGHFGGTTTREKVGIKHDVAGNEHGIVKVPLDLVQDILGGTAQKEGAGLGLLALDNE